MATNDMEVNIKSGRQTNWLGQSSASDNTTRRQFKEILMELDVTPHIKEDGQNLTLDLKLTNDTLDFSKPDSGEPFINTREAATNLQLKDGETIVIGGIVTEGDPGPEGRPVDGRSVSISDWMFKDRPNKNTELLIFLTANIIPLNI
jgi:Type II secretory pathway, component HofQ